MTQVLSSSVPTSRLIAHVEDAQVAELLLDAMEKTNMIRRYGASEGIERWDRVDPGEPVQSSRP